MSLTPGARQGEILDLEWRLIDFENKLAYLKETKNGRPRSIFLADAVIDELKILYQNLNPSKPLVLLAKQHSDVLTSKKLEKSIKTNTDRKLSRTRYASHFLYFCSKAGRIQS